MAEVEQQIKFTTSSDGVSICYATVGEGPPLVKAPNWLSHLEFDWRSPVWRHWWEELAKDHLLVRFDQRGIGLSDWSVEDLSFDARVLDLEAVVDAVGLERFALLGISQGGACAIEYAVRHPERVTHLVLYGAYARGTAKRGGTQEEVDEQQALLTLMRQGWGRDDPVYRQIFTSGFIPGANTEQMQWFNELQRVSASAENAVRTVLMSRDVDIVGRLGQVSVPTLVLHARDELRVPFAEGRRLAAMIPGARFVPLEGKNHILLENEPAWPLFLSEVRRFLGTETTDPPSSAPSVPEQAAVGPAPGTAPAKDGDETDEAYSLIASMDTISLSRFSVVPGYAKFDEGTRNLLKDARQKIAEGLGQPGGKRENHLFWAAPGSGKTYFVQQTVASLSGNVHYHELNLAKLTKEELLFGLRELDSYDDPCLCLIDEIDAKPEETWPYEILLPYLDAAVERDARFVFVMAGSSGSSIGEMKQRISARPKGADLLSRVPSGNEHQIPPMGVGDRVLVVLSQFRQAGMDAGKDVREVEKLALYYVAATPHLANARQLRELAVRAVQRMPTGEDRVKYDHLFPAGDPENKEFYMAAIPDAAGLVNTFVAVQD
ncbi:MAG: alpha/beta fold hydrolase [Chloroflexi bacterium]|nr:alpha/beta fold hydrolase [Chloroflexota bacterium]